MNRRVQTLGILVRLAVSLLAIIVFQGILSLNFRIFRYIDLPLVFAIYFGFTLSRPIASIFVGSALGLMQDSLSGAMLGTNGFSKTLISVLAASAGLKFNVDQTITRVLAILLFTAGDAVLVTILTLMAGSTPNLSYGGALGKWVLSATFNSLLGLALLGYHDRWGHATT